jgi:hypothetical protein
MKRNLGWGGALVLSALAGACTGAQGPQGKPGTDGTNGKDGTGAPSVSAVTPSSAFLGRTVDLSIAGSGTTWSSSTTVTFGDSKVKVNKVTAASATGLLVNVTVGVDAAVAPTDVTVQDGSAMEVYKGAFQIKAPLEVTVDPPGGVPQGGLAAVHVQMLDVTTPFDPNDVAVAAGSKDVAMGMPQATDFALDFTLQADVLAKTGTFDMVVTSGSVDSPARQALLIAARAPTTLTAATPATGMITTEIDTVLYQFTPAAASSRFLQFTVASMAGQVFGTAIPKSGKYADALGAFGIRFGQGATATDPFYIVVGDANSFLTGPGPVPADLSLAAHEVACTAASEAAEVAATNNDTAAHAQKVTTLPALISGTLGYGAVDPATDVDYYQITVSGAPKKIHVATGGDGLSDVIVDVHDSTDASVAGPSADDDYHQDLVVDAATDGTYFVTVDGTSTAFDPTHNTYQLFIEVK